MSGRRSHTMADVARLAGVSIATVSAVINDKGTVGAERTHRVREAMQALDYQPDAVARSLKTGRTNVVGMIVPDVTNPFYTEVMRGVDDEARRHGYDLLLCDSAEDSTNEQRLVDMLFARRIDGVLLSCSDSFRSYERYTRHRVPVVFFDRVPAELAHWGVVTDNVAAAYEATRHLIALGHRRIAAIAGNLRLSNGVGRVEGFRKAMREAGLVVRDECFWLGNNRLEGGYEGGLALLGLNDPPTAIFSCNNRMTLGLMRALGEREVACPQRVSVLGFDDFEWAASFRPRLTAVAQPTLAIGAAAMGMLLRRMCAASSGVHIDDEPMHVFRAELRVRESTAPPPEAE